MTTAAAHRPTEERQLRAPMCADDTDVPPAERHPYAPDAERHEPTDDERREPAAHR